jgi:hypothetical protein
MKKILVFTFSAFMALSSLTGLAEKSFKGSTGLFEGPEKDKKKELKARGKSLRQRSKELRTKESILHKEKQLQKKERKLNKKEKKLNRKEIQAS